MKPIKLPFWGGVGWSKQYFFSQICADGVAKFRRFFISFERSQQFKPYSAKRLNNDDELMDYRFQKVTNKGQVRLFHEFPFEIYEGYEHWIPPLQFEVENVFSPEKNPLFEKGECERYLMYRDSELVARFAVMNHSVFASRST
jgi:hypothetical protein